MWTRRQLFCAGAGMAVSAIASMREVEGNVANPGYRKSILTRDALFGSLNLNEGTKGPYWAYQGCWNTVTRSCSTCVLKSGSSVISGFSDTSYIKIGIQAFTHPVLFRKPWPLVQEVGPDHVVVSGTSIADADNVTVVFGLPNDGRHFSQRITQTSGEINKGTEFEWSWPAAENDASVYSYPCLNYGTDGGYNKPENMPPAFKLRQFRELYVKFDVSVSAHHDDYDCLIETFPTSVADPPSPHSRSTIANEVGFLPHVPSKLMAYIVALPNYFHYSRDGFHAYVATRTGAPNTKRPPFTMIVPVVSERSRTPLDMIGGPRKLPVKDVLLDLVARGTLSPDSFINGFSFGFEIAKNGGSAIVHELEWTWK